MKNRFMKTNIVLFAILSILFVACQNTEEESAAKVNSVEKCWDENTVFPYTIDADVYPTFKNGDEALLKFISEEVKYPNQAKENGEEGKVFVQFVVKADGSVSDFIVIRGVSKSLDEESIRVAKMTSGMWNPGTKGGIAINAIMTLPIYFKLQ